MRKSTEKKVELIRSIHSGFPIGALLLSDHPAGPPGVRSYFLIDGLQRTNSIVEYLERPLRFAVAELLPVTEMELLRQDLEAVLATSVDGTTMTDAVLAWLHATEVTESAKGFDWSELLKRLVENMSLPAPTTLQTTDLKTPLATVVDKIRDNVDIGSVTIPVLTYSGPVENLPDIFERLNSKGTILTKYQVLAATWIHDDTLVVNAAVRSAIEKRYEELEGQGIYVDRPDLQLGETASLFEYLFGLSSVLLADFRDLFGAQSAADASVAFQLATLIRGERLSDLGRLPERMGKRDTAGRIVVSDLEKAILFASHFVKDALQPFLGLQLTKEPSGPAHGELQIISLVASVAAHRFATTTDWQEKPGWAGKERHFRKALPQHYLLDILRRKWHGPTYTLAFDRVWKSPHVPSDEYLTPPSADIWDTELKLWFEDEELGDLAVKRPYTSAAEKLILKFIYSSIVTVADQATFEFDVEHLYPVDRLVPLAKADGGDGWPIGCISNLALLDKKTNRRKKTETIQEWFARVGQKSGPTPQEIAAIRPYLLCDPDDVSIPIANGQDSLTRGAYDAFLAARWETMKKRLYSTLGVPDRSQRGP